MSALFNYPPNIEKKWTVTVFPFIVCITDDLYKYLFSNWSSIFMRCYSRLCFLFFYFWGFGICKWIEFIESDGENRGMKYKPSQINPVSLVLLFWYCHTAETCQYIKVIKNRNTSIIPSVTVSVPIYFLWSWQWLPFW